VNISVIDVIFILVMAIFVLRCFIKGFISEVMSMAALVLGILSALFFYKNGGEFLRAKYWPGLNTIPEIIAFAALFIIVFIVIKLFEIMLKGIVDGINLGGADRFLGMIFGLAEGIAVISLVLFVLCVQPLFDPASLLADSFFAQILLPLITKREIIINV